MPPLHKSFSEQNKRQAPRQQQWQRSKSNPVSKPSAAMPLVPVAPSTKNKLQAFQFETRTSDTNHDPFKTASAAPVTSAKVNDENVKPGSTSPRATSRVSDVTTTPINRLAWRDLLGVTELPTEDNDTSPSERIIWRNDPRPSITANSPVMPRRRKRARSSSPVSSPAPSISATPNIDVKKLTEVLKTPHADPALELWDRFSLPGTDNSPSGPSNPLLAHLMVSSSPRPNKDGSGPGSERSLRKALSCGSHWPKRRRIERTDVEKGAAVQGSPQRDAKSSMVSALLETVDGELRKTKLAQEEQIQQLKSPSPQKRSPQRRRADVQTHASLSPVREAGDKMQLDQTEDATSVVEHVETGKAGVLIDVSSDYGDENFDDDTLFELDKSLNLGQGEDPTLVSIPEPAKAPLPAPIQDASESATADEDFGDLDDDFFEAAGDLIAQVESHHPSQNILQAQQHNKLPQDEVGIEDDEFGDDFGGDFDPDAAEMAATQQQPTPVFPSASHASQKPKAIQRYLITNVLESSYEDDRGRKSPEKVLLVQVDKMNQIKTIHLRGDWYDTQASVKAYVHIIGAFEPSGRCIVDNNQNSIILHPDQLISSTVIADSFSCMRRAVLQDRVKATSDSSPALVYGTILHEIFQEALMANQWDMVFLGSVIDQTLKKHLEDIYIIKVSMNEAREHLLSKMTELRSWAQAFVSPYPRPNATVQGRNGERANMCVSKLLDVEEHVWSPMYGLKGNIDATVQVTMRDGNGSKTLTVPFEVKTGKNVSSNHQAQTALYNLLLSDRYDIEIAYGILYYMETSQTIRIPAVRHELRHMIMQRNQLACYIRERSVQLPPMKKSKNACGKCYAQTSCFVYHKLADDGTGETSGLHEKFDEVVKHLTPVHKEFFLKWEDLLTKEERESQKLRRELWTMVSTEREKVGRCFANVVIEEGSASEDRNQAKINRFTYTMVKENPPPGFSFLDSQLTVGEPIVISDEQGHFALALGYVTAVRKQRITVAVDRRLHNARIRQPGFDEVDNQVFASIMQVGPEEPESSENNKGQPLVRYRLDKDEFSNGMATVRNNLVQVMNDGPFGSREIRRLVVDLVPPRFKQAPTQYAIPDQESLNPDQTAAVKKVMSAMDYALVLGMPGTGKTTTIAHIIRALIGQGKTVLLTSYTHTAVDNILLKLKHDNIPILRLGAPAKIHPEIRDFVTVAGQPMDSFEEIQRAWHDTPVVATTCLGINHPVFQMRTFDYCIVDEASQITLPICLGPIRMARTFVLVGDHNQLPPLVQNEEARVGGLDVSLFKLLSDTHPESVVNLEHQYRMCEDIMMLSNTLIYNGRLKCGTSSLRFASLSIPNMDALRHRHFDASTFVSLSQQQSSICPAPRPGSCWLRDLLDPEARVRFVNTDFLADSREQAKGNRIVNPCEAQVVAQLVDALLTVGVPPDEIGVMTHYRSQLALLKRALRSTTTSSSSSTTTSVAANAPPIEMHTADRFQGRDKAVIVLSLVRNNEACSIGELLKDWRRINVAFTRAKTKLFVVGSRSTLSGAGGEEMLAKFVGMMEAGRWVYDLQPGMLEGHCFDSLSASLASPPKKKQSSPPKKIVGGAGGASNGVRRKGPELLVQKRLFHNAGAGGTAGGKEVKKARIGERAMLKGKPVLRDILNDMLDGGY